MAWNAQRFYTAGTLSVMEILLLAKDIQKIKDAWNYNNASSCGWAMNEFERYANHVLRNKNLIIERKIKDLPDFFSWKNEDFRLSQIPVFTRTHANKKQIDIGNRLLRTIDIQKAEFKNPYLSDDKHYVVNFTGSKGLFSVDLGQIIKGGIKKMNS